MTVYDYFNRFTSTLDKLDSGQIEAVVDAIGDCYSRGNSLFLIGNGGSGSNASHFCEDLGKGTLQDFKKQRRLRVISLTDNTPYILALGNDFGFESIFIEQLKSLAGKNDYLIAISGSGNSANVLRAVEYANSIDMVTIGITGFNGGQLSKIVHKTIHVPSDDMGIVEAIHNLIFHYTTDTLRERFKKEL